VWFTIAHFDFPNCDAGAGDGRGNVVSPKVERPQLPPQFHKASSSYQPDKDDVANWMDAWDMEVG
jgi:hypothetical protein